MLRRVRESLLKQGVERQEELMLEYVGYPAREDKEPMRDWIEDFNDAKRDFENSMGKEEGTYRYGPYAGRHRGDHQALR